MRSKATPSVTSSPGSAVGAMPSGSPDGPTSGPSGPAPFPVSRFRALDSDVAMPIEDTCGPLFSGSSPSADLQRSLESRLRASLDVNGSPEYALIWSTWDMPAGPPICRLRASAHRTSGNGSGGSPSGWPTPDAQAFNVGCDPEKHLERVNAAGLTHRWRAGPHRRATMPRAAPTRNGCSVTGRSTDAGI